MNYTPFNPFDLIQLSYLGDPVLDEIVDQPGEIEDDSCPDCGRAECRHTQIAEDEFECEVSSYVDEKSDYERAD